MRVPVSIESTTTGYSAHARLGGGLVVATGGSRDDTLERMQEAILLHLDVGTPGGEVVELEV